MTEQLSNVAFLIPGQGSQVKGMGAELLNQCSLVRRVFEQASDFFGVSISRVCIEDPFNQLPNPAEHTSIIQKAMLTLSVATALLLREEGVPDPREIGVHSAGKLGGITIAGALSLEDSFKLIGSRGDNMEADLKAAAEGSEKRGVGLLRGYSLSEANQVLKDLISRGIPVDTVRPTIINPGGQILVGGIIEQLKLFLAGFNDVKNARLFPKAPLSHHFLLSRAQEGFNNFLDGIRDSFKEPTIPIQDDSTDALLTSGDSIKTSLRSHIDNGIDFARSIAEMNERGIKRMIEIGSGTILGDLIKKAYPDIEVFSTNTMENIRKVLALYNIHPGTT